MKKLIKKALLMALLAFLCGTQGYAVKLNNKGQKMVSRLVLRNFETGEAYSEVVFTYDDQNSLKSVMSSVRERDILFQKEGKNITAKRYERGKLRSNYQLTIITDNNGNISETQDDCIGIDGSRTRQRTTYAYDYCPDLDDYVMCSSDSWPLGVTPKGEVHPVSMVNGHYIKDHNVALVTYRDGNAQTQRCFYSNDKLLESFSGHNELFYNDDIDDTNINMATLFGGFSCDNPMHILLMTEWAKRKTKNLIVGVDNGKGKMVMQAEYSRDADGNIVEMREQLGETGFLVNIEYVE